ncbi:zinc transporter ZIP14-like isoform X2 [Acanthaster planci]|uniref:Zinc transporter ZIP14-like isoform X2 n=1 Tax=Acanthaster planci TaxID=133434 RepID=A0A8B7YNI8_ACAPL|nr:zinc transporter ZIP14-like isoform X2 [Acanthaster planci]
MSRKVTCLLQPWLQLFIAVCVFPPCGSATSTGPRGSLTGMTTAAPLPTPEFFLDGIIDKFGQNGRLNEQQLLHLLQRVPVECLSVDDLLRIHSLTEEELMNDTAGVLQAVCPSILFQAVSDDCSDLDKDSGERKPPTTAQVWGYGVLFVTIINLAALMGACIIPCMDKKIYKLILTYLVGLAVGTLSGNALLSLIPETHGMYVSTHGLGFVWRNTTIIGGIYLFFVVERLLKLISSRKEDKRKKKNLSGSDLKVSTMHNMSEDRDVYKITLADCALRNGFANARDSSAEVREEDQSKAETANGHGHSHLAMTENGKVRIAAVAYMIVFGDGLHNFIDGLAIGASFSISVFQGISTSIAVICEEFPHELGDFAILLKSGMTVRQALLFNLLSALTCYGGLIVGILVGQLTSMEPYIFALAGGMFLYISLVDMLPELHTVNQHKEFRMSTSLKIFAIQNAGLLTGYAVMILLAVYGEHITLVTG